MTTNFVFGATNTSTGNLSGAWGGDQNNATGDYSAVVGGQSNTASGIYSGVFGGNNNSAQDSASMVFGGSSNFAVGSGQVFGGSNNTVGVLGGAARWNTILGGKLNTITDSPLEACILGGFINSIDGTGFESTILGGSNNSINSSGNGNSIIGGATNSITSTGAGNAIISGSNCTVPAAVFNCTVFGNRGTGDITNAMVQGAGSTGTQRYQVPATVITANNTQTTAYQVPIASGTSVGFVIRIAARRSDAGGESAFFEIKGMIHNNSGTTTLVGAITSTTINFIDAAWSVTAVANNGSSTLDIKVTGETGKTILWFVAMDLYKVKAP